MIFNKALKRRTGCSVFDVRRKWVVIIFNTIIIIIIIIITIIINEQIWEDSHLEKEPKLHAALNILNYVFCIAFTIEMLLKMTGFGITKYFASAWNCLDAFIVAVSIVILVPPSAIQ